MAREPVEEPDYFEKQLIYPNQHPQTARTVVQFGIPVDFARKHISDNNMVYFHTDTLRRAGVEPMEGKIRPPARNNGNYVVQKGWGEFLTHHRVQPRWWLYFTLLRMDHLLVQRINDNGSLGNL